jgi:hypothetical protein
LFFFRVQHFCNIQLFCYSKGDDAVFHRLTSHEKE